MQLTAGQYRFFIAIIPPPKLQAEVTKIKDIFANNYSSKAALKSPPHITLQAPFIWAEDRLAELENALGNFACDRAPVKINLSGFAAFPPRVIYIDVLPNCHLDLLQQELSTYCNTHLDIQDKVAQNRPFVPHMTVAFRDLTKANFHQALPEFQRREFVATWLAEELNLLIHNGQKWEVKSQFSLGARELIIDN